MFNHKKIFFYYVFTMCIAMQTYSLHALFNQKTAKMFTQLPTLLKSRPTFIFAGLIGSSLMTAGFIKYVTDNQDQAVGYWFKKTPLSLALVEFSNKNFPITDICWKKAPLAETDFVGEYESDVRAVYVKVNGEWVQVGYDAKGQERNYSYWKTLYSLDKAKIGYIGFNIFDPYERFVGKPEDQAVFDYWKSHVRERT
jgi:hypothetical protein